MLDKLNKIASVGSTNTKRELVGEYLMDVNFEKVCVYALDSFRTYGLNKIDLPNTFGDHSNMHWPEAFDLLDKLAARELTGNAARSAVTELLSTMSADDAVVFERIIKRDLRCGVGVSLLNKVRNGLIPTFDVMLASGWEDKKAQFPALVQPKFDGLRCVVLIQGDDVTYYSRGGKEFDTLGCITPEILRIVPQNLRDIGLMLDTEVISTRGDFQQTCSDVKRKDAVTTEVALMVFDAMQLTMFMDKDCPFRQSDRTAGVDALFNGEITSEMVRVAATEMVNNTEEAQAAYAKFREEGYEGAIVKDPNALYAFKRSAAWMKLKPEDNIDLEIVSYFEGTGKYAGMLGGFDVMFEGVKCSVGGGFSDAQRKDFWEGRDEMIGNIIEVQYMEKTADGAMRHPRFICVRSFKGEKA